MNKAMGMLAGVALLVVVLEQPASRHVHAK